MADLNALIAQGAQFQAPVNPFVQYGQMQQLQQGANANELAQYTMAKAKQEDVTRNALNQAYQSNMNPDTGEINYSGVYKSMAGAGAGAAIPGIQQQQFKTQQEQAGLAKTKGEVAAGSFKLQVDKANKAISDIAALNSPEEASASIDSHLSKGDITQEKADMLKTQLSQAPSFTTWQKGMLTNILDAKEKLTMTAPSPMEVTRADGSKIFMDKNPNSPTFNTEIMTGQAAGMTPFQTGTLVIGTERNRIAQGQLANAQQRLQAEMATGNLTPATIDFIAETYRQTGTLPPMGMGPMAAAARSKILTRAGELSMAGGQSAQAAATNVAQNKQDIAGQTAAVKDFSAGPSSKKTTAVSTALNHLETIDRLTDALSNGDMKVFNLAANKLGEQTGKPAPTNMDAAAELVGAEVIKAIVLNGGTGKERDKAAATFANAKSPDQLKGAANTYRELLGGQLTTLAQQYETGTGRQDFAKKLSPAAIKLLGISTPTPVAPPTAAPAAAGGVDTSNKWLK